MDFKFSKESGDSQPQENSGGKKKQSTLLVLLLVLVGGFTYLYFFTDLIKPQEEQKTAVAPVPAPQVVKIPLPPREGEPAKPEGNTPEKTEAPKAAAPPTAVAAAPAAKQVVAPAKPATVPVAKPAPVQPKANEEPKKVETAKSTDKSTNPVSGAEKKAAKATATAVEVKKPAVANKKGVVAKDGARKSVSSKHAKPETAAKAKKAAPDSWSIVVGNYVLEEALAADMGRVRKAGLEPTVKPSVRKKSAMNRLLVSEFNDRVSAQATFDKLKRHTSDAFIIERNGRFTVYAGSYLQNESATSEKERLKAAGINVTVKHIDIAIPSQSLSVGPFKNKKAADTAIGTLKRAGIKAALSQK